MIIASIILTVSSDNDMYADGEHPWDGKDCDTDLMYWAREDIWGPDITAEINAALAECYATIGQWTNPAPCPGSCNEVACVYSCALANFFDVIISNIFLKIISYFYYYLFLDFK